MINFIIFIIIILSVIECILNFHAALLSYINNQPAFEIIFIFLGIAIPVMGILMLAMI